MLTARPGTIFKIKADGGVPARTVTRVFDALIDAGAMKILMLTDPLDERGEAPS